MTNDRTQWHRLAGLVLKPLFERLGYETEIEVDLSLKKQLVDIITVRKAQNQTRLSTLPEIYWEAFSDLNEHNLLSFKSYSESFDGQALEEFYGHLTNYKKTRKVKRRKINLYALSHHYPRKLFKPFEGTAFLETVKEKEIFDLKLHSLKRVRFIIMRETKNPLLALFSDNPRKITESYRQLKEQETLLADVSIYFKKTIEYYGEEVVNMYTKEDFFRDYPPSDDPFVVPWMREIHEELVRRAEEKVRKEAEDEIRRQVAEAIRQAEEVIRQAELKAKKEAEQARREAELKAKRAIEQESRKRETIGVIKGKINAFKTLYERGVISEAMYHSELHPLEKELEEFDS